MRLIIHCDAISERGDSVNAESLSLAMKKFYNIESFIVYQEFNANNNRTRIKELQLLGLNLITYRKPSELHSIGREVQASHSYFFNGGNYSGLWVKNTKKLTHAIFNNFEPHGDRYNYNSHWLYKKALFSRHRITSDLDISKLMFLHQSPFELDTKIPISWVPHIVESKIGDGSAFRSKYLIGKSNTVLGRIGGINEFNDRAAISGVIELLEKKEDLFCVFVNTKHFYAHKRLIYIEYLSNEEKWDFYSACDILINGRLMGESFGFAVCEALASGKPIIAPSAIRNRRMDRNHIKVIADEDLLYNSQKDFVRKVSIQIESPKNSDILRSKVSDFRSEEVSKIFFQRFLLD